MDPTSLPTDNLYKFVTLACLLAVGVIWYVTFKARNKLGEQKLGTQIEQQKHAVLLARIQQATLLGPLDEKWSQTQHEADLKTLELDAFATILNSETVRLGKISAKALIAMIVLLLAIGVGAFNWYTKVQWFQDQVTYDAWREQRAKADLAEIKLAKAKAPTPAASAAVHPKP